MCFINGSLDMSFSFVVFFDNCVVFHILLNPPGVDSMKYNLSEKTKKPSIVYYGGYRRYKRPLEIVLIFKEISDRLPDVEFTFVGRGPEIDNVKSKVQSLNI